MTFPDLKERGFTASFDKLLGAERSMDGIARLKSFIFKIKPTEAVFEISSIEELGQAKFALKEFDRTTFVFVGGLTNPDSAERLSIISFLRGAAFGLNLKIDEQENVLIAKKIDRTRRRHDR